jgi:hypothetical protein
MTSMTHFSAKEGYAPPLELISDRARRFPLAMPLAAAAGLPTAVLIRFHGLPNQEQCGVMADSYWGRVRRRAWADAIAQCGFGTKTQVVIKVLLVVAAIFGLAVWSSSGAVRDEIIQLGAVIATLLVFVFPVLYLVNLITAPAKLEREARQAHRDVVTRLETEVSTLRSEIEASYSRGLRFGEWSREAADTKTERILIEITNEGTVALVECLAKIVSVQDGSSPPRVMQSALRPVARHVDGFAGRFKLGVGETKLLLLATKEVLATKEWSGKKFTHQLMSELQNIPLVKLRDCTVRLIATAERGAAAAAVLKIGVDHVDNIWVKIVEN